MKTVPPLHSITIYQHNGGFANDVYFTFSNMERGFVINKTTFRARIRITGSKGEEEIAELLRKVALRDDSASTVVEKLQLFAANLELPEKIRSSIVRTASQIEAGEGPDTRREDELFEN